MCQPITQLPLKGNSVVVMQCFPQLEVLKAPKIFTCYMSVSQLSQIADARAVVAYQLQPLQLILSNLSLYTMCPQ
jgi:hypothetical protein